VLGRPDPEDLASEDLAGLVAVSRGVPRCQPIRELLRSVADLHALLAALRAEGCNVLERVDDSEYGKFGWVMDPEGNKVELWEPPDGQ
jgi:predicted enzyme related to lactoylglutathione lyase